jgi:hypothetical protein
MVNIITTQIFIWLVVWNMNFMFPYIGNFIIPTDKLIFFRGLGQPPTSYGDDWGMVHLWHWELAT